MELLPITSDLALASYLLDDKPQVAEAFVRLPSSTGFRVQPQVKYLK